MSRIGKSPVGVPKGVQVKIEGTTVSVKGPKGELKRTFHDSLTFKQDGEKILVAQKEADVLLRKFWGLSRTLLANMMEGVANGYTKQLLLVGVGYRAVAKGKGVQISAGLSHQVDYDPPAGITMKVDTNNEKQSVITITGPSKELVGDVAAKIRSYRPAEPYHGKGIRYVGETVTIKQGKAAAGTGGK
jgi:large subunit ribosomal protein L6